MAEPAATVVERHPDLVVVHLKPESIDASNLTLVHTEVVAAGEEAPQLPVVVDMGRVNFMPSMSLAGLIQLAQHFRARKQRLVLINLRPAVREALAVTRLDRLFEIHQDLPALMVALG